MKITFLPTLIVMIWSFSVSAKKKEAHEIFSDDKNFNTTEVPQKWQGESAVILARKTIMQYPKGKDMMMLVREGSRCRIKLQDKAAVELFSTFYYKNDRGNPYLKNKFDDSLQIVIIKPDGNRTTIGTATALNADNSLVPDFYRTNTDGMSFSKVALPNIEIGDIIDYTIYRNLFFMEYGTVLNIPPVYELLNTEYPILKQQFVFDIDVELCINYSSLNGAPEIKKTTSTDKSMDRYEILDIDRESNNDLRWQYSYRDCPSFRIKVINPDNDFEIMAQPGMLNNNISTANIKKVCVARFKKFAANSYFISDIVDNMKKHSDVKDKKELAKLLYYYFRNDQFARSIGADKRATINDFQFALIMKKLCEKYDIPFDVIITVPRSLKTINELVSIREAMYLTRINNEIVFPMDIHFSNYYDHNYYLEGAEGYLLDIDERKVTDLSAPIKLPTSSYQDNNLKVVIDVNTKDGLSSTVIKRVSTYKGLMRNDQSDAVLRYYDWSENDFSNFGGIAPEKEKERGNKKEIEAAHRKQDEKSEQMRRKFFELNERSMKAEWKDIESFDTLKIVNDGRSFNKPELVLEENFVLGSQFKKIGTSYSFDLGSYISSQIELEEKEKERTNNIWLDYAKSIEYEVNFTIPDGYKVQGSDGLKYNIDNNTGAFITDVSIVGSKLTVKAKKLYKSNYLPKEDWSKMVEFLEAAYNFTQKKIILVKNS